MIIEEWVKGKTYQLTVVGDRVVAAAEIIPAYVVGDGQHSVRELIELENARPERGERDVKPLTRIVIDEDTEIALRHQGLKLDSVPEKGRVVYVKTAATTMAGGVSIDVTEDVHPDNAFLAVRAAKVIKLPIAAITFVCPDISESILESEGMIVAVSPSPDLRAHMYPVKGEPRNIAREIIRYMFRTREDAIVPLICACGASGKSLFCRILSHVLTVNGRSPCTALTEGVLLRDHLIYPREQARQIRKHAVVLREKAAELGVLEVGLFELLEDGVEFETCDYLVFLGYPSLDVPSEARETVKEAVEVLTGLLERGSTLIINVEDPLARAVMEEVSCRVAVVSTDPDDPNFRCWVDRGAPGATVMGRMIVIKVGDRVVPITNYADAPVTVDGLARHILPSLLSACLAAYLLGVEPTAIASAVLSFTNTEFQCPARLNFVRVGGKNVLVDVASKPSSVRAVLEFVRRYARRYEMESVYCALGIHERLHPTTVETLARITRQLADDVIAYPLGRVSTEEITGYFEVVSGAEEALKALLSSASEDDMIVLLGKYPSHLISVVKRVRRA